MTKFRIIDFTNEDLSSLILSDVLIDYSEQGGTELAFQFVSSGRSIMFETSSLFKDMDVSTLLDSMRSNNISEFELLTHEYGKIIGLSEYGDHWVIAIGDNIGFIKNILNDLWYSTFEYL
jgi:hypothetical protein